MTSSSESGYHTRADINQANNYYNLNNRQVRGLLDFLSFAKLGNILSEEAFTYYVITLEGGGVRRSKPTR